MATGTITRTAPVGFGAASVAIMAYGLFAGFVSSPPVSARRQAIRQGRRLGYCDALEGMHTPVVPEGMAFPGALLWITRKRANVNRCAREAAWDRRVPPRWRRVFERAYLRGARSAHRAMQRPPRTEGT